MLRSNMSAMQGLAEGVIPVGVALFFDITKTFTPSGKPMR